MLKKYKIDPTDEHCIYELLKCEQRPEQPMDEDKLNSETFRNYERQRMTPSNDNAESNAK